MTDELINAAVAALVVLARIGGFMAVFPVLSLARLPMAVRAYMAIAVAFALTPLVQPFVSPAIMESGKPVSDLALAILIFGEVLTGLAMGMVLRIVFLAASFAGEVAAQVVGFSGMFMPSVGTSELTTPLADLLLLTVAVMFLALDLHTLAIEALLDTYRALPPGSGIASGFALELALKSLGMAFQAALQLAAPFVVYAIVCNLLLGLANRLVPQVPIQMVAAPAVLIGGLLLAYGFLGPGAALYMGTFAASLDLIRP